MRILVAEDDDALGGFVRRGLEAEHYAVDVSNNGVQVRLLAQDVPYDLLLLDLTLPQLDGMAVLRQVRVCKPTLPVLVLSARSRVEERVQCLDLGADDFLAKPFAFAELSARIRALLRRCHTESEAVLQVGDLRLDRLSRVVERAGRRIDLTAKEFALLEYLMKNAGRRITRSMIAEHVWSLSYDTASNLVDVYIAYFFRNQPQLDALRTIVLPRVVEARAKTPLRKLKFWSAGCSTGEEPYTLAILLSEELNGLLKGWTFEIVATDLNERSLEHAKQGLYGDYAIRNLSPTIKQKYFTPQQDRLQVNPSLKSLINFSRLNLQDDARMLFMKSMDVIFCCNVLIYFDVASKRRVIQHFYSNLLSHGYFFMGHSESLYGVNDEFRLVHMPSATAYMRGDARHVVGGTV